MRWVITGAEDLIAALADLGEKRLKRSIRRGARAACKVIHREVMARVPVDTGRLKAAIKVKALPRSRRFVGAQVNVPVARTPTYYAGFVELGTVKMKARRFMRDALDASKDAAAQAMVKAVQEEVNRG